MLQILQGFQMASSPELASAINALLLDDGAHMRMAPTRKLAPGDSERAAEIVKTARDGLGKYKNVTDAEHDGYVKFLPWLDQPIYHYNNLANILGSLNGFNAAKPVSLLYKKDPGGGLQLVGAMYAASMVATNEDLDARLPISIAHWHEHVNFCGPDIRAVRDGRAKVDAASSVKWIGITSKEECDAAGGMFVPRLFGWMAHVYMFASDDPKVIWGADEHATMDVHVHPPIE
jgi:hypothetical protein